MDGGGGWRSSSFLPAQMFISGGQVQLQVNDAFGEMWSVADWGTHASQSNLSPMAQTYVHPQGVDLKGGVPNERKAAREEAF